MLQITTREDLGKLFESVNQTGTCVEVGVQLGWNTKRIIDGGWTGVVFCVDNWVRMYELESAKKLLADYPVDFIQADSALAASKFADGSIDCVYIDADHSYEGIKRDFEAWYPKVRSGGIVSGHDYGANNDCPGVKQFIDEYMAAHPEIKMYFTTDDFYHGPDKNIDGNEYQTWHFVKP